MNNLYLDIETFPSSDPAIREGLSTEDVRKLGLSGLTGEIICIGWALGDGEVYSIQRDPRFYDELEDEMLGAFWAALKGKRVQCFVGHNITKFDLRFLYQRSLVCNVRPTIALPVDSPPWRGEVYDTMTAFAGFGKTVSLDKLCKALGVPSPKNGIDGSKVYDAVLEGRIDEVATYCRADVEATRAVYRRLMWLA